MKGRLRLGWCEERSLLALLEALSAFPATDGEGVWCPDAIGDLLLGLVALFARQV